MSISAEGLSATSLVMSLAIDSRPDVMEEVVLWMKEERPPEVDEPLEDGTKLLILWLSSEVLSW